MLRHRSLTVRERTAAFVVAALCSTVTDGFAVVPCDVTSPRHILSSARQRRPSPCSPSVGGVCLQAKRQGSRAASADERVAERAGTTTLVGPGRRVLLTQLFDVIDRDQNRLIDANEMEGFLAQWRGRPPSQAELQSFLRPLSIKWENGISVDEFILAVEEAPEFASLTSSQLQGIIITMSKMGSSSMWNPLTLFDAIKNSDRYKERSRLYRRTVFTAEDWVQFRSSERIFKNLATMFTSGVVRGRSHLFQPPNARSALFLPCVGFLVPAL